MARILPVLLCGLALACAGLANASDKDDGFIWVDANTKIRIKPIGKAGAAATGGTATPKPKKEEKEKAKK
jgi:hypothetical protein